MGRGLIYEFREQDAYDFARNQGIEAKPKGEELQFKYCPYCGGGDKRTDKGTFAINLRTGAFNCKRSSCGAAGNMLTLAKDFDFHLSQDFEEYYRPKKKYKAFKKPAEPIKPKEPAVKYLESRGISEAITKRYEITTQKDKDNILVFPFFDESRTTMPFVKYRKTDFDKTKDKNKEWSEAGGKPILFGMNHCNMENETLIVTEGQVDSLSLAEAGIENAVSVPTGANGFTWIPYCWDFVNKFQKIIVFGDYEKGHITLLDEIKTRFKAEIFHVREEDYKDCKDANDILRKYGKDQLKTCIENAERVPLKNVVDIADIKPVDVYSVEKCKTGIKSLDDALYGGLPFPGVVVLTGKSGEGKSTLGSQIIARAIQQGYMCFAYSGELSASNFKAWLDFQIAGRNHIFVYQTRNGYSGYNISDTNRALISEWYRGKLLVYDTTQVDSDNGIGLLKTIEDVILQYGVRVILLDNLMTALTLDLSHEKDKYERQSTFTKKLAKIALQHDVLILLVAHKRKNSGGDEMDDVLGSSDITNLGTVTMSYGRDRDINESQRTLRLLKNRLFGKINTEGWILDFDEKSKRIYGRGDDPDYEFGWAKEFDEAEGDIPFK